MSIRRRLIMMMATLFMMGVSYLAYDLVVYKNDLEAQKHTQLNNLVKAQASQLGAMLSSGMSEQEALTGLKEARYAGNEYFFVIDRDLTMVMHPFKESLNGTSVASRVRRMTKTEVHYHLEPQELGYKAPLQQAPSHD